MTCAAAESLLGRFAVAPQTLEVAAKQDLELHLAACARCRATLGEQQEIAAMLHSRPLETLPSGFAARLAARLDAEPHGILGLADWRVWTATLAPVAAALVFAAWTGLAGPAPAAVSETAPAPETFAGWTEANAGAGQAAVFLQSSTGDVLLESILVGAAAPLAGSDGR